MALPPKPRVVAPPQPQTTQALVPIQSMADLAQPSQYEDVLAKYAADVSAVETEPGMPFIKTKSGIFVVNDEEVPDNKLQVVVLGFIRENQLYRGAFDENNPTSPICFSFYEGKDASDAFAHELSMEPQNPTKYEDGVTRSPCLPCPNYKWGSDPRPGSRGKACREVRRLAVVSANGLTPETLETTEVYGVKIPVMSVAGWATYVKALAEIKRPPFAVITELGTVPDKKSNFRITFKPVGPVQDELIPKLAELFEASKERLATPYQPSVQEEVTPEDAAAVEEVAAKVGGRPQVRR